MIWKNQLLKFDESIFCQSTNSLISQLLQPYLIQITTYVFMWKKKKKTHIWEWLPLTFICVFSEFGMRSHCMTGPHKTLLKGVGSRSRHIRLLSFNLSATMRVDHTPSSEALVWCRCPPTWISPTEVSGSGESMLPQILCCAAVPAEGSWSLLPHTQQLWVQQWSRQVVSIISSFEVKFSFRRKSRSWGRGGETWKLEFI